MDLLSMSNLETEFVDKFGISKVLFALALIADEKAEHVRSNWQDENLAIAWERVCRQIEKVEIEGIITL